MVVQAIVDMVRLAPETVLAAVAAAPGRFAAVTDMIAAGGMGQGIYRIGDREVHVTGSDARLADGTLAGSLLTLDTAVRNLIDLGVTRHAAIAAVTTIPARLVGRPEFGTLRPGTLADVTVLDAELKIVRTIVAGHEMFAD